eukprot:TRINITY_DN4581_c0_g8_i1.p1 TRINITY_DN4581_c0_g8~~TRINITY_DN4581_c0_g8_i1.p1  ORF type:complete len:415 (+),score=109.72 TRINITY_DN4581_c0_g8_i1:517-1761(+)
MQNLDAIIGGVDGDGHVFIGDYFAPIMGRPSLDIEIFGADDIMEAAGSQIDGITTLKFKRKAVTGDRFDKPISNAGPTKVSFAYNEETDALAYHGPTRGVVTVDFAPMAELKWEDWSTSEGIAVTAINSFFLCVTVAFAVLYVAHRKHAMVKSTSPLFSSLIFLGAIIGFCFVYVRIPKPTDSLCISQPWLFCLAFTFIFVSLTLKSWRIAKIFEASENFTQLAVKDITMLAYFGSVVAVVIVFLVVWTTVSPPKVERGRSVFDDFDVLYCSFGDHELVFLAIFAAMMGVLVLTGVVIGMRSWSIPSAFNEARYMIVSLYNSTLILLVTIPVAFALRKSLLPALLVWTLGFMAFFSTTIIIIFVPRMVQSYLKTKTRSSVVVNGSTTTMRVSRHHSVANRGNSSANHSVTITSP